MERKHKYIATGVVIGIVFVIIFSILFGDAWMREYKRLDNTEDYRATVIDKEEKVIYGMIMIPDGDDGFIYIPTIDYYYYLYLDNGFRVSVGHTIFDDTEIGDIYVRFLSGRYLVIHT